MEIEDRLNMDDKLKAEGKLKPHKNRVRDTSIDFDSIGWCSSEFGSEGCVAKEEQEDKG